MSTTKEKIGQILTNVGATEIVASYDGMGDDGDIEELVVWKGSEILSLAEETVEQIKDLAWTCASDEYPGFELNDGSHGILHGVRVEPSGQWAFEISNYENEPWTEDEDDWT